jgi:SpoIID/LytB domain protein
VTFRTGDGTVDTAARTSTGFTRKGYRGSLEGLNVGGSIAVTNVVAVEAYLRSVVANEVSPGWPGEALRAQAVAARSYALRERHDRGAQSFHVYDSTKSQVYPGLVLYDDAWNVVRSYEDSRTDAAVQATAGQYLQSGGLPAFTQFSSSNGGWTAAGSFAYLPQQRDDWDRSATANPYREWTQPVAASSLEGKYPQIGTLVRIRILERSGGGEWGGRVMRMTLDGTSGSVELSGDSTIRSALGTRSSYFAIS